MSFPVTITCDNAGNYTVTVASSSPAADNGMSVLMYDFTPQLSDISPDMYATTYKFTDGIFYDPRAVDLSRYSTAPDGSLIIGYGACICGLDRYSYPSTLPLLDGSKGFYIDFEMKITSDGTDEFPAVWVMPQEHNLRYDDVYNIPNTEEWVEFDVHEGNFAPGSLNSMINWTWSAANGYTSDVHNNYAQAANETLDQTVYHKYGMAYLPATNSVRYYLDDVLHSEIIGAVSTKARLQHFYPIMNTNTHGANVHFDMWIKRLRAWQAP